MPRLGSAMVERFTADHYFVTAENIEFSEWVDVTVADTLPASEMNCWGFSEFQVRRAGRFGNLGRDDRSPAQSYSGFIEFWFRITVS